MFVLEQQHLGKMFCTSAEGPTLHVSEQAEWFWKVVEILEFNEMLREKQECQTVSAPRFFGGVFYCQCQGNAALRLYPEEMTCEAVSLENWPNWPPRWVEDNPATLDLALPCILEPGTDMISKSFQVIEPSYSTAVIVEPLFVETWGPSGRDHSRAWISSSVSTRHGRLDNDDVVWTWLLHLMDLVGMSCLDWLNVNIEDDVKNICAVHRCVNNWLSFFWHHAWLRSMMWKLSHQEPANGSRAPAALGWQSGECVQNRKTSANPFPRSCWQLR